MNFNTIIFSALCSSITIPVSAIELSELNKQSVKKLTATAQKKIPEIESPAMISFAAKQLKISENTMKTSLGILLKVAKESISQDKFALISKALPDTDKYISAVPKIAAHHIDSLLTNTGSTDKKADSLQYLDTAFEKIGLSKEQVPVLVNTLSTYIEKSGYEEAAGYLKQTLNFL